MEEKSLDPPHPSPRWAMSSVRLCVPTTSAPGGQYLFLTVGWVYLNLNTCVSRAGADCGCKFPASHGAVQLQRDRAESGLDVFL